MDETFEEFREAAQLVADYGWGSDPYELEKRKNQLHDATYADAREQTDQASLVQSARNLAANALSNCEDRLFDGENTSKPEFRGSVVVYNGRTITYNDDHVTLATTNGRVRGDYVLPHEFDGTPFEQYWTDEWEKKEATLHRRNGDYYLHVAVKQVGSETDSAADEQTENGVVLGVDLNVDGYIAVTSTGAFLGNADYLTHRRNEYERRRGTLQQTGTRSAHLTIGSIGGRFARWSLDYLHRVSNGIVHEARTNDCTHIAFERLVGIRKRISNALKFQQWAFKKVQELTEYKAETYGIGFETVNPAYTSQRCSHSTCGFTHEDNRDGDEFECRKCGKQLRADYNAARNIAWKLVQNRLKSGAGRATSQLALKSGTVNANGEFFAADTASVG